MKAAAFGLGFVLLVLPFAARSDENLVAKREACRQEARLAIAPKGKIGVDGFQRIVKRRVAHVSQCMARPFVARNDAPLPPKKATAIGSVRSDPAKAEHASRLTLKTTSNRILKVQKTGRKQLRRLSRGRK
ncbi:hypothetical protein ACETIH_06055 [Microvirga arabica]|uniref:Uncharacterized protein n=1 Tax=Microvirga arabica TaxID=1128671 RepID=A0ABV6Y4V9_9HYPH